MDGQDSADTATIEVQLKDYSKKDFKELSGTVNFIKSKGLTKKDIIKDAKNFTDSNGETNVAFVLRFAIYYGKEDTNMTIKFNDDEKKFAYLKGEDFADALGINDQGDALIFTYGEFNEVDAKETTVKAKHDPYKSTVTAGKTEVKKDTDQTNN